jgi:HD-like signal output (HDOD) protein
MMYGNIETICFHQTPITLGPIMPVPTASTSPALSRTGPARTSPARPTQPRIESFRDQLGGFGLPAGASEVIHGGDFDGRGNRALAHWLSSDRELSQRLLRWCNTPLYNLARPFRSLEEAGGVMDGCELARLAVLASVRGYFLPDRQIDQYHRETLWSHSIAVGTAAAIISRTTGCGDASLIFVAGALHDIGLRASEHLDPKSLATVMSLVDELSPVDEVERELLGWDHALLGEAVVRHWGLPDMVAMVARYHHEPERVLSDPSGHAVACVTLANYLCSRAGWGTVGRHYLPTPSQRVFAHLGIDEELLRVLWQQLYVALESVKLLR